MEYQNFKKRNKPNRNHSQQHRTEAKNFVQSKINTHTNKTSKPKQTKNHLRIDLVNKKKQNKDLKIYANAKPKFKPKCLTSNVNKKLKKPQRQDQVKEKAKFIIS